MVEISFIIISIGFIYMIHISIKNYIYNIEQWWIALPIQDKHELVTKYLKKTDTIYQITRNEKIFLFKQYNK